MVIEPTGREWRRNVPLPVFGLNDPLGAKRSWVCKTNEVPTKMAKQDESKWEKVESTIVRFEKPGDACEGVYTGDEPNQQFGGKVYKLVKDGKPQSVFGTSVLDSQMRGINVGEEIRIVFTGTKENKNKSLNAIKLFDVFKVKAK